MDRKVLIIVPKFPPNIRVSKIVRSLLDKTDSVYILFDKKREFSTYKDLVNENCKNLRIYSVGDFLPVNWPYNILRNMRIRSYVNRLKPDLVWCNDIFLSGFLNKKFKLRNKNIKYVLDICDNYPEVYSVLPNMKFKKLITNLLNKIEKQAIKNYDLSIFVSPDSYTYIKKKHKLDKFKYYILYNLPYLDVRRNVEVKVGSKNVIIPKDEGSNRDIVYIGTIDENIRDLVTVIKAISYLKKINHINVFFDVYYFDESSIQIIKYTNMCKEMGIEKNVSFKKAVPHSMLNETLRKYSIGIVPHCRNKGVDYTIPNKLFDYMLNGLCPLVSDNPALKGIVAKYNIGKVYRGRDYINCAQKIRELLDSNLSKCGETAIKIINGYLNWNKYFDKLYNIIWRL